MRPYPSLRITFTSPALRIPGLLQTKFLDRIGGATHIREGILDSLAHGTGVTAKVSWLTNSPQAGGQGHHRTASVEGKPRWIHCTPLLGSDEKVGVWMVLLVDDEIITGQLNRNTQDLTLGSPVQGAANPRFTGNKLYAEYLRREGRPESASEMSGSAFGDRERAAAAREKKDVDNHFRDF